MTSRKFLGWVLAVAMTGLVAPRTSAQVMVSVQATVPHAISTNAGMVTVSRTGTTNTSVTINLSLSGTATPAVDYAVFPTNITLAANVISSNLTVAITNSTLSAAKTVVVGLLTNTAYFAAIYTNAVVTLLPLSDTTNSAPNPVGRYWRGTGSNPTYWSVVVPLDYETGTVYSNLFGNTATLYPGVLAWSSVTNYHYNATNTLTQTNVANRIPFNNPIVAFGERVGGTPLYLNQPYNFGVYAGIPTPLPNPSIVINVYNRTNTSFAGSIYIYPPVSNTNQWINFSTNGFQVTISTNYDNTGHVTTNTFALATTLSIPLNMNWGSTSIGSFILTHTASNPATNYYYLVQAYGYATYPSNGMVIGANGLLSPSLLYTLEYEQRPPWRSVFLDQPHFDGSPLPPFYAGKTVAEMLTNTPPVTNVVSFTPSAATNLDDSPELRRHPTLDNFVASMNNDPIALANYVINQIDLTDPMDYSDNGNVAEQAINPTGMTRGALGTFMEKQGSPIDQCALLVYMLRQAGVPAVYEFAPRGGLQILDARLSRMLKFQVHGGFNGAGNLYTTNTMITVNYPWVAAYISNNWVHIFPWLKDYEINEGLNLYEYMPTNYSSAYAWVQDYVYGKTNLLSLASDGDNTPRVIFPKYIQQTLLQNHPGVSLDDIGVKIVNRQHYYARWQDFPTPTWVTNVSTPLESLTSSGIAGISPTLTNIFDTVSVEIYSVAHPTNDIQTGDMRLVDLHNREFYIYQYTNGSSVQLNLILLPFRTNITTQFAYSNDTNLLSKEMLTMTLGSTDNQLGIRFRYHRHRALSSAYAIDPAISFLGFQSLNEIDYERPLLKGDQAAICMDYGRVTRDMLNAHATDLWQMENALRANPSLTNTISPDVYIGATMYLAGMSYYEKVSEFGQINQQLHKMDILSSWAAGLSKISPARDSSGNLLNGMIDPVFPNVDMFLYQTAITGNGTVKQNSGQILNSDNQNYGLVNGVDNSAEEHQVINRFYQQTNAVSTVRLLQLAQQKNIAGGIVPLNYYNYIAQGNTTYQGHTLQSFDPSLWAEVVSDFQNPSDLSYVIGYITPGPVTNSVYKGMGALVLGWGDFDAIISPFSLNGGFAGQDFTSGTISLWNLNSWDFMDNSGDNNNDFSISLNRTPPDTTLFGETPIIDDSVDDGNLLQGNYIIDPYTGEAFSIDGTDLGVPQSGSQGTVYAADSQQAQQSGVLPPGSFPQYQVSVNDPVNAVTGEFYVHETDLQLPGPLPLALHRNYSSQSLADNQFGMGWKLSIVPFLSVSVGSTNIYAADMDGAVLAYVRTSTNASVWLPSLAANPQLNNNTTAGAGGLVNRLRDSIVQTVNGSTTNYALYGADGSVRTFQAMTFNNGIMSWTRPYLQQWTDNRGNYYTFAYSTNSSQPNYGQMIKIQCSNGNFLGFDYDIYGHIIDAYTGDGRWVYYDYNEYGDLITVTLPDSTQRSYQYLLGTQAVTNNGTATYSTHLIIEEDKPDGRVLQNAYDSQRRVTNQLSTAGADLNPIRTGTFIYSNNFNITNSFTNAISGSTLIVDGNGNTNRYIYTNDLITQIIDPLNQTNQQIWYPDNATVPGYPRSVATRIDKRGLVTQYQYDGNGNVTNTIVTGDLTGDGITSQTATNTAVYNTNNLPVQMTDPVGNGEVVVYDPTFTFMPQRVIRYAGTTPVSTNFMFYGNSSNIVVNGSTTQTNMAFGVVARAIRAYGSTDAATNDFAYDGHGFLTQSIRYTGTVDPNVTSTFFYNERGDQVSAVDALGAVTFADYDALDRPIEKENFDEFGNPLSWSFNYYDDNGELNWVDGPRYNPEDYVFYDYDGAGRVTTEIHWRSAGGSINGPYVVAPSGYNLYAQTFYQYDPMGNLKLKVDPRGAMTTNTYDAICRLVQRRHIDVDGVTVLSTEGFGYEPGGQVHYYTNALGAITTNLYTSTGKSEYRGYPDGSTNGMRYFLDGRVKREIQSNGAYWQTTYDDVNRITTRTFYSAAGVPLATNSVQLDRRGNAIQKVDAGGNTFTTTYDGLDRAKTVTGPPSQGNTALEVSTNFYDVAGRVLTNKNAIGEMTITKSDAIGRPISAQTYSASGTLVHETYMTYSPDHNSVTTTSGSGASAIVTTTYTDTDGHTILTLQSPSTGALDSTWTDYDLSGNVMDQERFSSPFNTNDYHEVIYTYDGLNRPILKYDRDNAITTNAYDAMGNLTNRAMPGGLTWQATYNKAGQMLQDRNVGSGNAATRTNTYTYYPGGSPFAGLLQTKTDGRGVTCTYTYDSFLRIATNAYTGSLLEQQLTTTWQYEPRGFATNITEQFANSSTGPATTTARSYDAYGHLASESVTVGGASFSSASQGWDAAGRRSGLNFGSFNYSYGWQADGNLISASDSAGSGTYSYDTAGLLTNRTVGVRTTGITSRDGEGRPLSIATTVNSSSQLTESMSWGGDGLLNSDMLARADFTDSHAYSYALLSRRLIQEKLNLNASTSWTNTMVYDGGVPAGLGVLTQMGKTGSASNLWTGSTDAFSRVNFETNNTSQYPAYGHANGQATLTAWLDSQPVSVTGSGTNTMQWRATMELTPGAHQLKVSALQPSGYYTASATASFTNNRAYQTTIDGYDAAGDITNRIWRNPNGTTNRIQSLSWDARGRLQAVTDRDSNTNGYNWTAVYDGLSRRLQTVTVLVSNGVAFTSSSNVISQYYDPQVEFLELGVACNNQTEWKLYGPDLNGRYGGLNGTGGFDSDSPGGSAFNPTISDMRGNILAVVTNGVVAWNPSRLTGYGAVPGYGPVALGNGANVAQSSAWRGRWVDITGYYQIGLRPYDPVSGRWLTYDSVWNERDPNYYTFAGGEPIMGFDADGRLTSQYYGSASGSQLNLSGSGANTVSTATSPNPNQSTTSGTTDAGGQFYQAVDISIGATGAVQTGAELSSTIDNGMVYLSGLLESGSVAAKDVSSFAGDVGGPLGGIAIMWNVAGLESGNIDKTEFWINFGVTIISVSGPYGADFGVGYFAGSLVNTFVPGVAPAAQVYFQPFTDDYYGISHTVPISIGDINNDHYSTPIER